MLFGHRFYSASSSDDKCYMMSDRNVINQQNVREDRHKAYKADRDFFVCEITACVICTAYYVFGLMAKNLQIPPHIADQCKMKKLQFLHNAAAQIVDVSETA